MHLSFLNDDGKSAFFRDLRLIHDDLHSYASAAAPYCALNEMAENAPVSQALKQNAMFWNCVLLSLQTNVFVSLGRLHDKAKHHNHIGRYIKAMKTQNAQCKKAANELETAIKNQSPFIEKALKLRHNLFAHTNFHAPLISSFGFEGIKMSNFRTYWNDVVTAMEACDVAMFGTQEYGPKFDRSLFSSIEEATMKALPNYSESAGTAHET